MRILSVANRYPPWSAGGYEAMAAGAVRALRAAGHTVRVLTTGPDPSDRDGEPQPDVHRDLRWYWRDHEFPRRSFAATVALERANRRTLRHQLDDLRPEIVLWWAMGGMSLSLIEQVRRARVPALGVVGDDWMSYGPSVDAWTRRWRSRPALAGVAERVVGVPARVELDGAARWLFISEFLRSRSGLAPDRTGVAHPGVDQRRFAALPPNEWRWRLLYCGRIDPRKGITTAIEALKELPPQATLTIDGDGETAHAAELVALADRLELGDRVELRCSAHAEVPRAYAAADAVVFPVRWEEPWGLVPLEAMATGRPVIASAAGGGTAEYLRDQRNCLTFEPGDASGLAATVWRLAGNPRLRAELIAGGHETASAFAAADFHATLERELGRAADAE